MTAAHLEAETIGKILLEETDLDKEGIRERVKAKIDEYDGMVNRPAACMLIGREEGLDMQEQLDLNRDLELEVQNLVKEMNDITIKVEVRKIWPPNTFERDDGSEGKVQNVVVGDETGETQIALWDDDTEAAENIDQGDELLIKNGYSDWSDYNDRVEIGIGDETVVKKVDSGEVVLPISEDE